MIVHMVSRSIFIQSARANTNDSQSGFSNMLQQWYTTVERAQRLVAY